MLNINKNIISVIAIYILVLLIELFHFGSDFSIIITLESLLCFSILLYMLSNIFQDMFVSVLHIITFKYSYIYLFFKYMINLNLHVYKSILYSLIFFFFNLLKNFVFFIDLKKILIFKVKNLLFFLKKNKEKNIIYTNLYI